jgi:RNA polymerase sigma factor (sigma-70 family)
MAKNYGGESSPYWNWANARRSNAHYPPHDHQIEMFEDKLANPDIVAEPEQVEPNISKKIMRNRWRTIKFSKREREVLFLLADGKTQHEIAKILNISRNSIATIIHRIREKGEKFFVTKVQDEGVIREEEENL